MKQPPPASCLTSHATGGLGSFVAAQRSHKLMMCAHAGGCWWMTTPAVGRPVVRRPPACGRNLPSEGESHMTTRHMGVCVTQTHTLTADRWPRLLHVRPQSMQHMSPATFSSSSSRFPEAFLPLFLLQRGQVRSNLRWPAAPTCSTPTKRAGSTATCSLPSSTRPARRARCSRHRGAYLYVRGERRGGVGVGWGWGGGRGAAISWMVT